MKLALTLTALAGLATAAQAASEVNEFLSTGYGAGATSMGRAFVAVADDATAAYWNPAGLTQIKRYHALFNNRQGFVEGQSEKALAVVMPRSAHVFGLSYFQSDVKSLHVTSGLTTAQENLFQIGTFAPDPGQSENARDSALLFSWATKPMSDLSVGLTAKLVDRDLVGAFRAFGYGLDAGALYRFRQFAFGVNIVDLVQDLRWKGTLPGGGASLNFRERAEIGARVGAAAFIPLAGKKNIVVASLGAEGRGSDLQPRLGAELRWDMMRVGAGLIYDGKSRNTLAGHLKASAELQPTWGVGVFYKAVQLQFAMRYHPLGWTQEMAFGLHWGRSDE